VHKIVITIIFKGQAINKDQTYNNNNLNGSGRTELDGSRIKEYRGS
jgi:hypothetical protein